MTTIARSETTTDAAAVESLLAESQVPVESPGRGQRMLYLAGRPSLRRFIRYVRSHAAEPASEREVAQEWSDAHEVVRALEREEAGIADAPTMRKLGPEYEPLLERLFKDPQIRGGFNTVPTDIVLVELDKLVVYQKHIDLTHARRLSERLGPSPGIEAIFRTCLPDDHPKPPVKWSRVHGGSYVFVSPSNDLRSLGSFRIQPSDLGDPARAPGSVAMVGISIGFGSNFLNAIHAENRLILNNGSHRAFALRNLGVTHVPCIVQHVKNREELAVVGDSSISGDADYYLASPRPAMLRDYFDSRLHTIIDAVPRLTQIRVTVEVDENWLPAL